MRFVLLVVFYFCSLVLAVDLLVQPNKTWSEQSSGPLSWSCPLFSDVRTGAPPYDLAVCVIVRNEGDYILEWIIYHHLLGFGHFYVYDNESTDGLRERLAPFIANDVVTFTPWPGRGFPGPQKSQIAHCLNASRKTTRWVGVFDVDEYVIYNRATVPSPSEFLALFRKMEDSRRGAFIAPRFAFDSNNHDKPPHNLTLRAYTTRSSTRSKRGKAFIFTPAFAKMKGFHDVSVLPGWKVARLETGLTIFHYQYRSRQECLAKAADDHKANPTPTPKGFEKTHTKIRAHINWRLKQGAAFCNIPLKTPVEDQFLAVAPITDCTGQLVAAATVV
jgi:hypothetical protein